jgi:hypothetical protein
MLARGGGGGGGDEWMGSGMGVAAVLGDTPQARDLLEYMESTSPKKNRGKMNKSNIPLFMRKPLQPFKGSEIGTPSSSSSSSTSILP